MIMTEEILVKRKRLSGGFHIETRMAVGYGFHVYVVDQVCKRNASPVMVERSPTLCSNRFEGDYITTKSRLTEQHAPH